MGAPYGNRNSAGGDRQQFRQALKRILTRESGKDVASGLERIALKLLQAANEGESWAIREIADRIDGKPAMAIDVQGTFRNIDVTAVPLNMEDWRAQYVIEGESTPVPEGLPAPTSSGNAPKA